MTELDEKVEELGELLRDPKVVRVLAEADRPVIRFGPAPRGRVTGFAIDCTDHGPMPVLAPSRRAAITAAELHKVQHGGDARIVETRTGKRGRRC